MCFILFLTFFVPGVVVVSWYPKGMADHEGRDPDLLMPLILNTAQKYNLKVCWFQRKLQLSLYQHILQNYFCLFFRVNCSYVTLSFNYIVKKWTRNERNVLFNDTLITFYL